MPQHVQSADGWRARAGSPFATVKAPARGSRGMVVTNHPLASAAGVEILAGGGNAIDAAVASLFTLGVVEPMMVGIFGAGWTNIRLADGRAVVWDNYSCAPLAATPDLYQPDPDAPPGSTAAVGRQNTLGYRAPGVPGTLKAWTELAAQFGTCDLETLLAPAIRHASRGYRQSRYGQLLTARSSADLALCPNASAVFLPGGAPVPEGDLVRQPELAESLRTIAAEGPDALYGGALGAAIIDDIARHDGIMTLEDLRAYRVIEREPLVGEYRGHTITVPPPPTAGGVHLLQMLRLLEGYDLRAAGFGSARSIHLLAESLGIAFADRGAHLSDPDRLPVPVDWLTSAEYAAQRRAQLDLEHRTTHQPTVPPGAESDHTTHVTVADADGNVVAMTQTINELFGAKVMAAGTGILLNNTMAGFEPAAGLANSVAPGRRSVSSMTPTIITRDGRPRWALGTPGGLRIFPSVTQAVINLIDHGMSLQEAVEAPRVWTRGQQLELEGGVSDEVETRLQAMGHDTTRVVAVAGGMTGIEFDDGGMLGAACWRADGTPAALAGGSAQRDADFHLATTARR